MSTQIKSFMFLFCLLISLSFIHPIKLRKEETLDEAEDEESTAVVISLGSTEIQAGFAGDDAPRSVFPNIVGKPRHQGVMVGMGQKSFYVGNEAQAKRGILALTYPIQNGVIQNFDYLEKVLHHTFYNELRIAPEEHKILLVVNGITSKADKTRLVDMLLKKFKCAGAYILNSNLGALYASGRTTGVVLNTGGSTTVAQAFVNGKQKGKTQNFSIGVSQLTNYLQELLSKRGYSFTTTAEREIVKDILGKLCFVSTDYKKELTSSDLEDNYELPDGQVITIKDARIEAPEALFNFGLIGGPKNVGIANLIVDAAKSSGDEKNLMTNVVISGINSSYKNLASRTKEELEKLYHGKVKVILTPESKVQSWIGGSILSSLSTFEDKWITKA